MFGKGKQKVKATQIDTLIGDTTTLTGDLLFSGGLHVEGKIVGNIKTADSNDDGALLILNENGVIEGDVEVPNMVINGTVKGDLHVSGHVELAANAKIHGNVYYNLVEMAVGAQINGNLVHKEASTLELGYTEKVESTIADVKS